MVSLKTIIYPTIEKIEKYRSVCFRNTSQYKKYQTKLKAYKEMEQQIYFRM